MPRALWTGASGMIAQQTNVDVIANNIANVNTTGFKKQRASFQDLFYDVKVVPGTRAADQGRNPTGTQVGTGVRLAATPRIFTPGSVEQTGGDTDLAIEGDGFFRVSMPDGSSSFTRAGDFRVDADGFLVTPEGYYLSPQVNIPDQAQQVAVSPTGEVVAVVNGAQVAVGTLELNRFRNNAGLIGLGSNLFQESPASGAAIPGAPGTPGFGIVRQRALEKANVEVVTELVDLITAQRAFETNSKSIKTADEMLRSANEIVR
jgi:flagellar basal-body rod protein FlgG